MAQDNVVDLNSERNRVWQKLNRIKLIWDWSVQMHREGRMPPEVARAFNEHFGTPHLTDPGSDPQT